MRRLLTLCLLAALLPVSGVAEESAESDDRKPRTLVLALDGVPPRSVEAARQRGAFADWSAPIAMVSTFPSMTSVAFTAILQPFCVHPITGYEPRLYDTAQNALVRGSSKGYIEGHFPWRSWFHVVKRSFGAKARLYTRPMSLAWKMVTQVEELVLGSSEDPILAHLASTDLITHVRGDQPVVDFLVELDQRLVELERAHEEKYGRPLRVIMLSDHGNTEEKVTTTSDLRPTLHRAGFKFRKKLEAPNDIVGPTYGVVSYGVLYLDPAQAEKAARAAVEYEAVELAAWLPGPGEVRVVSDDGEAMIRWREVSNRRQFSYDLIKGDPLRLEEARSRLADDSVLGTDGFADEAEWFIATATGYYPDPLRRLADSLSGTWVKNPATVILSLRPDHAWGISGARTGAFLLGGRLEGTHGALDRVSTLGFLMANEPLTGNLEAIQARKALTLWFEQGDCISMTRVK